MATSNRTNHATTSAPSSSSSSNNDAKAHNQNEIPKQTAPSRAESPRDKMREKAMRMQRSYSNPRISTNVESNPSQQLLSQETTTTPISTRSPRDAMKYRRRRADIVRARNTSNAAKVTE
eukprot:jgi/Psemu1/309253/fgenesh1_kg.491_\